MAAPDPESFSLLSTLASAAGAVAVPVVWLWTKLDKKADKHAVNNQIQEVKSEQALHRNYFKDVFNKIEANEKASEARHRELLMYLMKKGDAHGDG